MLPEGARFPLRDFHLFAFGRAEVCIGPVDELDGVRVRQLRRSAVLWGGIALEGEATLCLHFAICLLPVNSSSASAR